jgi:hypothetical protein
MAQKKPQQQPDQQKNQQGGQNQGQRDDKGRPGKPQEVPDNLPGRNDSKPMDPQTNRQQDQNKQRQPQPAGQEEEMD